MCKQTTLSIADVDVSQKILQTAYIELNSKSIIGWALIEKGSPRARDHEPMQSNRPFSETSFTQTCTSIFIFIFLKLGTSSSGRTTKNRAGHSFRSEVTNTYPSTASSNEENPYPLVRLKGNPAGQHNTTRSPSSLSG